MPQRHWVWETMKRQIRLQRTLLLVLVLLLAACGSSSSAPAPVPTASGAASQQVTKNADGYADISVQQLAGMLKNKNFTLVNVHVPYEGEIPQTDQFIPYDEIATHLDQLPSKDAPIVLYCRSGSMSTSAAKELVSLGYTNVLELDGGFNAWQAAGYELLDKQ
jgi:rhodanese-related sulfurtransferase